MKKVSLVLATFNRDRYLKLSLKSYREQTFSDLEIIVVNDSKDNEETRKICSDFGARYIHTGRIDEDTVWW